MIDLTTAQKRVLHHCPGCGHLLSSHDGTGCVGCLNDGEDCEIPSRTIETTYAAVERLLALSASVPPGPCFAEGGVLLTPGRPDQMAHCDLRAGHAGAHESRNESAGWHAVWTDQPAVCP